MDKKEIKAKMRELLSAGQTKQEVFKTLSGQGLKDSGLAYLIAAYADPRSRSENKGKVKLLVVLMLVYGLIGSVLGWAEGTAIDPVLGLAIAVWIAVTQLLFAWSFSRYSVWAYNIFIFMSLWELSNKVTRADEITTYFIIYFTVSVALFLYVFCMRAKVFPGLLIFSAKKVKGEYVFKS